MQATLTFIGLYNWSDGKIMNAFTPLPDKIDISTLAGTIARRGGELEIAYSNYTTLFLLIQLWCQQNIDRWNKLYQTTQYDYNPIDNYDRSETRTWDEERSEDEKRKGTGETVHRGSDTTTRTPNLTETYSATTSQNGTTTGTSQDTQNESAETNRSAFNSSAYQPLEMKTRTAQENSNVSGTSHNETTDSSSTSYAGTETTKLDRNTSDSTTTSAGIETTENKTHSETIHAHGNIGVTTTQQMIDAERSILNFNMYDLITEEFLAEFCILIY